MGLCGVCQAGAMALGFSACRVLGGDRWGQQHPEPLLWLSRAPKGLSPPPGSLLADAGSQRLASPTPTQLMLQKKSS